MLSSCDCHRSELFVCVCVLSIGSGRFLQQGTWHVQRRQGRVSLQHLQVTVTAGLSPDVVLFMKTTTRLMSLLLLPLELCKYWRGLYAARLNTSSNRCVILQGVTHSPSPRPVSSSDMKHATVGPKLANNTAHVLFATQLLLQLSHHVSASCRWRETKSIRSACGLVGPTSLHVIGCRLVPRRIGCGTCLIQ